MAQDDRDGQDQPLPRDAGLPTISSRRAQQGSGSMNHSTGRRNDGKNTKRQKSTKAPLVGDYDEGADQLWEAYVTEAESHDRALVETWKDDMESIIIFAGLYSASLTAFIVESYQNLQADPVEQTMQFSNQSVTLLVQISRQLGANGGQTNLSFPDPQSVDFSGPAASDVRINIFWFMSLVFSLSAVLFATIVQQWVRDYMHHVFQRYSHSLKRARIRQFLYEGAEFWRMSFIVDAIPALIHISLFLFFIGLAEFLFEINKSVAIWTTVVISISAALYLWTMFAPIFDTQSPYQSPASGIFWYIFQTCLRGRRHKDHRGKESPISTDLTEGRVQIAMDESPERKERDARAIRWVIDNLTEDSELQPFVAGIPGSLNSEWGKTVWRRIIEEEQEKQAVKEMLDAEDEEVDDEDEDTTDVQEPKTEPEKVDEEKLPGPFMVRVQPKRPISERLWRVLSRRLRKVWKALKKFPRKIWRAAKRWVLDLWARKAGVFSREPKDRIAIVSDLSGRITRMLKTCTEYGILSNDDRKKRARACIDAALQLVLSLKAEWQWFSESETVCRTLVYLGKFEKDGDGDASKPQVQDNAFAARRACMTVVVVQHMIQDESVQNAAASVIECLAEVDLETQPDADECAAKVARLIDNDVQTAWSTAKEIQEALKAGQDKDLDLDPESRDNFYRDVVNKSSALFERLDDTWHCLGWARPADGALIALTDKLHKATAGVLEYLPGALVRWTPDSKRRQPSDIGLSHPSWLLPQLLPPVYLVQRLWISAWMAQNINVHGWPWSVLEKPSQLGAGELSMPQVQKVLDNPRAPFQTQLWRAVDIREGGMVFALELLVNAMRAPELPRTVAAGKLFLETFDVITREWESHNNPGTQRLLVALLREVVPTTDRPPLTDEGLPLPFVDALIELAGKMLAGKAGMGTYVDDTIAILHSYPAHTHVVDNQVVPCKVALDAIRVIGPAYVPESPVVLAEDESPARGNHSPS